MPGLYVKNRVNVPGKAIFTNPSTAVNCGGAPQKIAYLAEAAWRKRGSPLKVGFFPLQFGGLARPLEENGYISWDLPKVWFTGGKIVYNIQKKTYRTDL